MLFKLRIKGKTDGFNTIGLGTKFIVEYEHQTRCLKTITDEENHEKNRVYLDDYGGRWTREFLYSQFSSGRYKLIELQNS